MARVGLFPLGSVKSTTTPAINATTFISETFEALAKISDNSLLKRFNDVTEGLYYGGVDTPTTLHMAAQVAALEKGSHAVITPSGQSAVTIAISALVSAGDHVLVVDSATYSTKWLFDRHFSRGGVQIEYFRPKEAYTICERIRANTRVVFMEIPGSFTFDLIDLEVVVAACRSHGVISIVDNTWSASTFLNPFAHGVDLSVVSLGKTHAASAGVSLGAVVSRSDGVHAKVKCEAALLGYHVSSEACSSALISISTLASRLSQQMTSTEVIIEALGSVCSVFRIMHPSIPADTNGPLFKKYFSGFNSLLSVEFRMRSEDLVACLNKLRLINIGYGWGGTLSLVCMFGKDELPHLSKVGITGPCARFYIGLEDPSELAEDIAQAFSAW